MSTTFQHYFLEIWLKSCKEPLIIPVAESAFARFQRAFATRKDGFFITPTRDGHTLALALSAVQMVDFVQKASDTAAGLIEKMDPEVRLWFLGKEPIMFQAADPVDMATIFSELKRVTEAMTLSFRQLEGSKLLFSTEDLVLFQAWTMFVEEGYTRIFVEERGQLPPS